MVPRWYVVRSKPRREELVWQQLVARGFESYYPRIEVPSSRRRTSTVRPYFPGYLFVRVNLESVGMSAFQWMPHAIGLVSFGGEPAVVPDSLVALIQQRTGEIVIAGSEMLAKLKSGDAVVIQDGPFAGYEAIFDTRLSGSDRVRVLIRLLNERYVPLQVRAAQLKQKTGATNRKPPTPVPISAGV